MRKHMTQAEQKRHDCGGFEKVPETTSKVKVKETTT